MLTHVRMSQFDGFPGNEDDEAWRDAIELIGNAGGGRISFDVPGESRVKGGLPIQLAGSGRPVEIVGLGRGLCQLVGDNVDGPLLDLDITAESGSHSFRLADLTIRRNDTTAVTGPVINHRQGDGKLTDATFERLAVETNAASRSTALMAM